MKKRKAAPAARHVRLYHTMMQTQAWRSLDVFSRAIYVELLALYTGSNNGSIGLSARQAAEAIGVSRVTAWRAMSRLQERGFIASTSKGRFDRKRHATLWRLAGFKCDRTGQPASRDYEAWETAEILAWRQT